MELSPGTVIERYTVESVLGEGGMAVVYRVQHNQLGTVHALKVLSVTSDVIRHYWRRFFRCRFIIGK